MPYYQDTDGQIYFFDYVPEPQNIRADLVAITDEAALAILNVPPVEVPLALTRKQAKQALVLAGLYTNVEVAIASISDETERLLVQVAWEDSETFERNNSTLLMLANALGLTSEQLDQMFITGATL
jgi:hypothetical protein